MAMPPEHSLQVKVNQWAREAVPYPHIFFSIDRTKRHAEFEHVRQKARGMVAGTSDTVLLYPGIPAIVIELKAFGKKVEAGSTQERFGAVVTESKHLWGWCDTVAGYCTLLRRFGVPLDARADLLAAHHDATLAGAAIRREEAKTGVVSRKRYPGAKPSAARIRKAEAMRAGPVRF